ncbi:MAG: penicillin acylase family protein [bacterium]|nr:penicillin acylase family protein [bacterium]
MKIKDRPVVLTATAGKVKIKRLSSGFPRIESEQKIDLHYGLGYMHAHDRQMQMWFLKTIGQGKGSELIKADEELIELDKFMRWIKLDEDTDDQIQQLSPQTREVLEAHCRGINDALSDSRTPIEFRLTGYKPDPWTLENTILMAKMIGFLGLSQSQGEMEKFILELIRKDIAPRKIKELFPYLKEEISADLIEIIKKVNLVRPNIPQSLKWLTRMPGFSASNNWAVSPERSASGKAVLCGDPHLALQLPSIWYSAVMASKDFYMMGATLPGLPSVLLGRSAKLAWSVTYGTMDMIDYFIEEVKDKQYRRGDNRHSFSIREETIKPKQKESITLKIYENDAGILEGDPKENGYYLNFAWSARKGTIAESLDNLLRVPEARDAKEAMQYFAGTPFAPFNWVMADSSGNIGYQLGGQYPQKPADGSGLLPFLAWDQDQAWQGMISPDQYPRAFNPEEGYIITANQDLNHLGKAKPMTLSMPSYRADRIRDLLENQDSLTVDDMKKIQYDLYSRQAEVFMHIIAPLLPSSENGKILKYWDRRYDAASLGATLFESVYLELMKLVFGENGLGVNIVEQIINETPLFAMLHGNFDQVLLRRNSAWFGDRPRDELYKSAIERGLRKPPRPYGKTRALYIPHIFFAGRIPKIFGFDYGPYERIGNRATIPQAQQFSFMGHPSTFAPTYRVIADFATDELHTNIPGGASDRRFSKYYTKGLQHWVDGDYDIFKP